MNPNRDHENQLKMEGVRYKNQLTWDEVNFWASTNRRRPNPSREALLVLRERRLFLKSEKNESVLADLAVLVPYGPALGPTFLGQPFKNKGRKASGPYMLD